MGGCQLNFTVSLDIRDLILSFYLYITLAGWHQLREFLYLLLFYPHNHRWLFKDLETWDLGEGGGVKDLTKAEVEVHVCVFV